MNGRLNSKSDFNSTIRIAHIGYVAGFCRSQVTIWAHG